MTQRPRLNGMRFNLLVALLLGAVSLGTAVFAPTPAAAQDAEDASACEFDGLYHLPIVPGDVGEFVAHAQCLLNEHWGSELVVDGEYSPETRAAVEDVQANWGMTVNGIVNPCTWYALHDDTRGYAANC